MSLTDDAFHKSVLQATPGDIEVFKASLGITNSFYSHENATLWIQPNKWAQYLCLKAKQTQDSISDFVIPAHSVNENVANSPPSAHTTESEIYKDLLHKKTPQGNVALYSDTISSHSHPLLSTENVLPNFFEMPPTATTASGTSSFSRLLRERPTKRVKSGTARKTTRPTKRQSANTSKPAVLRQTSSHAIFCQKRLPPINKFSAAKSKKPFNPSPNTLVRARYGNHPDWVRITTNWNAISPELRLQFGDSQTKGHFLIRFVGEEKACWAACPAGNLSLFEGGCSNDEKKKERTLKRLTNPLERKRFCARYEIAKGLLNVDDEPVLWDPKKRIASESPAELPRLAGWNSSGGGAGGEGEDELQYPH
ncbi:hypothetical protein DL96DRAFT_202952 [Flagelloscypha sp. PMI_526]|nr:hypothetical protein DL96DRAFT_202952 [Flagelloscypha sp. PMI_526]